MESHNKLGSWLAERLRAEHLSLREAAAKTGLSHATLADIIRGVGHPSPRTIKKLTQAFGGDGTQQKLVLEDKILVLAGYRSERPGEELNEPLAELMDKVKGLSEPQIKMVAHFADFLLEIGRED